MAAELEGHTVTIHMQRIAQDARLCETSERANNFVAVVKHLAANKFDCFQTLKMAESQRAPAAVQQVLKAAVAVGSVSGSTWGDELSVYSSSVAAFLELSANTRPLINCCRSW